MNYNEGPSPSRRQPVLPASSSRTLHHPSFLPLYMSAGFAPRHRSLNTRTVLPIIPAELFYTDPTMHRGSRIPNTVSEFRAFECFQLNTPPPVMSACLTPPNRPDPFRSGKHSVRDLGSCTWRKHTIRPTTQPSRVILQLTQEEDQAITNLLKLHHHEPSRDSTSAEESEELFCSGDVQHPSQLQQKRCWSNTELEAADTLLSRFSLMEEDKLRVQTQQRSEALPAYKAVHYTQKSGMDGGWMEFMFVEGRNTDELHEEYPALSPPLVKGGSSVFGDLSGVKERKLSDSEGDAVHVLLSLRDM